jgi:hypothetical protein
MVVAQAKIAILGGDPIVGGSLEALLRAAGYRAWFLSEDKVDEAGEMLANFQLLIVASAPSSEFREVLPEAVSSRATVEIPVLELLPVNGEQIVQGEHVVPWPCPPERLKRAIDAILPACRE